MSDMSDSDEDFEDSWVAPPSRKGKKKAKGSDAGAGPSSGRGSGAQRSGDKRPVRKEPKAALGRLDQHGSVAAESFEDLVKMLPRTSLEELLRRVIVDQEMFMAADVRALLPSELPDPSRRVDVVADETSNELGRFSRIPQTIIVGVLTRVPLIKMLSVVVAVCKGFRALWAEPLLFHSLTGIRSYVFSAQGVMRLLDRIPGKGEQVRVFEIDIHKMHSNDWVSILKRCPNLLSLDLGGKKIGPQVCKVLEKNCSSLVRLCLPTSITVKHTAEMWTLLKNTPNLRVLKFDHLFMTENLWDKLGMVLFEARGGIPLLEEMHFCGGGGMPWRALSTLGDKLPELKKLTMGTLDPHAFFGASNALRDPHFRPDPGMVFKPMHRLEEIKIRSIGSGGGSWEPVSTEALSFFLEKLLAAVPNIRVLKVLHGTLETKDRAIPALPDLNGVFTRCPPLLHLEELELGNMNVTVDDFASPFSAPKLQVLKLCQCGPSAPAAAQAFFEDKLEVFSIRPRRCFGSCGCEPIHQCTHDMFVQPASLTDAVKVRHQDEECVKDLLNMCSMY